VYKLWSALERGEQQRFFDAVGLKPLLDSIPESWRGSPKYSETLAQLAKLANEK
jgi:hypothetical protein